MAIALLVWQQKVQRLAPLLILAALSYSTVLLVAAMIFNEGPFSDR